MCFSFDLDFLFVDIQHWHLTLSMAVFEKKKADPLGLKVKLIKYYFCIFLNACCTCCFLYLLLASSVYLSGEEDIGKEDQLRMCKKPQTKTKNNFFNKLSLFSDISVPSLGVSPAFVAVSTQLRSHNSLHFTSR